MNRQEYWKEKGYTKRQMECHLSFERRKSKEARDRKKKNNEQNHEIIKIIKNSLLGKTFEKVTILRISETNDGKGFWYNTHKKFSDGSEGEFRYFYSFGDYDLKEFIKNLSL